MKVNRNAFTLIELLVAIGVIMLLIGLVVFGLGHTGDGGRGRVTQVAFENLRSMLKERETMAAVDVTKLYAVPASAPNPPTVDAPLSVGRDDASANDRYRAAVLLTHRLMRQLFAVPNNKQLMSRIPADQQTSLLWANKMDYVPGDIVRGGYNDPNTGAVRVDQTGPLFRCKTAHTSNNDVPMRGSTPTNWDSTTDNVPLLLDGWGNPIIYVPWGGLLIRDTDGTILRVIRIQPNDRPFFASAGPDGLFQGNPPAGLTDNGRKELIIKAAENNLYSFEN